MPVKRHSRPQCRLSLLAGWVCTRRSLALGTRTVKRNIVYSRENLSKFKLEQTTQKSIKAQGVDGQACARDPVNFYRMLFQFGSNLYKNVQGIIAAHTFFLINKLYGKNEVNICWIHLLLISGLSLLLIQNVSNNRTANDEIFRTNLIKGLSYVYS